VRAVVDELLRRPPESLLEELNQQHQELLAVLQDLTRQQESLRAANEELEETNRGVMALYAEVTKELDDTNRGVMALYAQLDDQAEELRRVNVVKDRFLSHLSHEFRTPLNATLALSRLLIDRVDGPLCTEQDVQVRFIRQGAEDLLQMVNDLLDIAKIEAGRMDLRLEEFGINDLIGALRGMFRPLANEAGIELLVMDTDPPAMLRTDRGKLAQVLRNLLSNAIKYTPSGSVRLEVEADGDEVRFAVIDTGVGIAAEELDLVFEEFRRGRAGHAQVQGTGLGLPLARELARLLGGELTGESEPGRGSVFRLTMPARLPGPLAETAETPGAEASVRVRYARPQSEEWPGKGPVDDDVPVVLVIDDDEPSRYVVAQALAPTGCRVVYAVTAAEGLAAARAEKPSAIFLDLILPDLSGFEVLRVLRDDPEVADCPVIIYTARALTEDQSRMLNGFTLRIVRKSDPSLISSITTIGDALVRVRSRSGRLERDA
jgi:signal transduction histidine kinase